MERRPCRLFFMHGHPVITSFGLEPIETLHFSRARKKEKPFNRLRPNSFYTELRRFSSSCGCKARPRR